MKLSDLNYQVCTFAVLGGLVITSAMFAVFPGIDLWAARLFAAPGDGFPLASAPLVRGLRQLYVLLVALTVASAASLLLFHIPSGLDLKIPARMWAFVVSVFLLGPGLLVNVILKEHWGRARPYQIEAFGGTAAFTPPFVIADQCERNCSFVSGEGSSISAAAMLLVIVFWHVFPRRRGVHVAAAAGVGGLGVILRMAQGRHFLSDSLLAVFLSALVILILYRVFDIAAHRCAVTAAALRHDLVAIARWLAGAARRIF